MTKNSIIDFAFTLEGVSAEEQPERICGVTRLSKVGHTLRSRVNTTSR